MKLLLIFWPLVLLFSEQREFYPVDVPLIYGKPELGWGRIYYSLEDEFDPQKPTVMILSDAITAHTDSNAWPALLGLKYNVVRIEGRDVQPDFGRELWYNGGIDWQLAYQVFNSSQAIEDIEAVRNAVTRSEKTNVFATSSAGEMLYRFMAKYGLRVGHALTVDPMMLGLQHAMGIRIKTPPDEVVSLILSDTLSRNWQSGANAALSVRCFEMVFPMAKFEEAAEMIPERTGWIGQAARPVLKAYRHRPFEVKGIHYDRASNFKGKSVVVSGVLDSLVDQRVDQALSAHYPSSNFFLLNDGHALPNYRRSPAFVRFVKAYLDNDIVQKQAAYQALWQTGMVYAQGDQPEGVF